MAKGKILVIDDEEDVRETLRLHLESKGYYVLEAENGEEGIRVLRSEDNMTNVGVILCDIRMPKMNGVEYVAFLRQEAPSIPVVIVTAFPDPDMAVNLMKQGISDYLVKPVSKLKLLSVVDRLVSEGKDIGF